MTKPRPWPTQANWARGDSIKWAKQIEKLGDDAKKALGKGNISLVRLAIVEMQHKAAQIRAALSEVESIDEAENEDEESEQTERSRLQRVR